MTDNEEVQVKITLIDEISNEVKAIRANMDREFEEVNKKARESQGAFANLGDEIKGSFVNAIKSGIMAYAGFEVVQKVTGFLKEAHAVAQEHNTVVTQLSAALYGNVAALIEQSKELEHSKFIHQEEILKADQSLSNYFKEESQIRKLIPAVIDLSKAKGIDLATAANMVAVAWQRGENAANKDEAQVGRLGITFEKTGDDAKDLDKMVSALNDKFGKQAQAVADSLDGWSKLAFRIHEVTKETGLFLFGLSAVEEKERQQAVDHSELARLQGLLTKAQEGYTESLKAANTPLNKYLQSIDLLSDPKKSKAYIEDLEKEIAAIKKVSDVYDDEAKKQKKIADDAAKAYEEAEKKKQDAERNKKVIKEKDDKYAKDRNDEIEFDQQMREIKAKQNEEERKLQDEANKKKEEDDKKWLDKEQANLETNGQKTLNEWANEEHEKFIIQEKEKKMREDAMNDTVSNLQFLASKHKEWGAAYKAMAIAQATIDTYNSAEAVLKGFSTIPVVGLELGIAGAAVAVAAGIANIQQIANQKFATGTYNAPGGYAMVGEMGPEMAYIPRGSQIYTHNETRNMTGGTEIHLHLPAGASVDYSAVDRLEKSLPRLLEGLADTNALRTFKSKLAKV